jgi:hypothetical protein
VYTLDRVQYNSGVRAMLRTQHGDCAMKVDGYTIEHRSYTVGPQHDPYGAEHVRLVAPSGDEVRYRWSGLGDNRVEFVSDTNGQKPVRVIEWFDGCTREDRLRAKCMMVKANIIARRTIGRDIEWAMNEVHSRPPMGCPKIYM